MTVEIITTGIEDLDPTEPQGDDGLNETDDHVRNIKKALGLSFPALSATSGGFDASAAELNHLAGVTSNVQAQLDATASRFWTFPLPDDVSGLTETWILQPGTLIMPRFTAGGTIIKCELPAISASTDGESIQVRPVDLDISPGVSLQLTGNGSDQFRLLTDSGLWLPARDAVFPVPPWAHLLCVFSSDIGTWVVRSLNSKAGQFS